MKSEKNTKSFSCKLPHAIGLSLLSLCMITALQNNGWADDDIQFNTDVLDVKDRGNIDLSQFSNKNYIMPGDYAFTVKINQNQIPEQKISIFNVGDSKKDTKVCFSPDLVSKLGFKDEYLKKMPIWHKQDCQDIQILEGVEVHPDLGTGVISISVPQAYLEYATENWVPTSLWDNGIPGVLADYNLNFLANKNNDEQETNNVSGNGTFGGNLGAWRARADWQANYDDQNDDNSTQKSWSWSRFYLYRPLPALKSKLTLGEDYLNSDMFDSFRFAGASLISDDNMLPPNLRGYAPEVTGIAHTNAKVTISQEGRVIYETQVAAGPFDIQDLSEAVSGTLDVHVQEQDGSVQNFKVNTASIPYLARPGSVRYKIYAGKPMDYDRHSEGDNFGSGEFSWGVTNGWSLYGGLLGSKDYSSEAVGIGRDLMVLGAIALDITHSDASLDNEQRQGQSYRLSYSKRFDETGSEVTFAGYRFSDKDFMSYSDFLDYISEDDDFMQSKEMYTMTFSQNIDSLGLSAYINYSHETYWNNPAEDRYNISLSRYFDVGKYKNINLSVNAYRNKFDGDNDDGLYISLSVPWGDTGTLSLDSSVNGQNNSNLLGYSDRFNNGDNYRVQAGASESGASFNGYYDHPGDMAEISTSLDYQGNQYQSAGVTLRGGMTATAHGAALHRSSKMGGTRMMVDAGEAADIPVQGYGSDVHTNMFGKAVVTDVSDYSKSILRLDLDHMPDNADASTSVEEDALTEGAIGYRKFNVVSGLKGMAVIRLSDGSYPPFGATVYNADKQEVGIVSDEGQIYLSGIRPGAKMQVEWNGSEQCSLSLPDKLEGGKNLESLFLPCQS
ncbi:outer membrane usher protein [Enterobacter bugandensis]|uniref:outer membrane usher protein n=1 Tax=Enterobacter bugandensis TaxID=881260 RepID=UPI00131F3EB3|nr:outer membrane usher protein [Enterobacter bugandensis]QWZ48825.1 outer membrane usher protein [Enterobacter bugandensis]UBH41104.1 outer membrane usher protein [Enterobacter bugandensis]UBH92797.1 outer membrane usher protein [Enterobacter bugandensis]UBH99415.1 outer membrane usher protein [Enterobacter bugandensis]